MDLRSLMLEIQARVRAKPAIAIRIGIAAVLVLVLLIIVMTRRPPKQYPSSVTSGSNCYYTADEGKTYDVGPWSWVPPYEKNGKTFVRMYKFQDGNNIKIGYFEKFTDEAHATLMAVEEGPARMAKMSDLSNAGRLVKKPGDTTWTPRSSEEGKAITEVMTSEGRGRAQPIFPK